MIRQWLAAIFDFRHVGARRGAFLVLLAAAILSPNISTIASLPAIRLEQILLAAYLPSLALYYRRNRDLSYILISTLYVLNILDAYVDAELFYFDVSDKLSLRTTPFMMHSLQGDKIGGLSFKLIF